MPERFRREIEEILEQAESPTLARKTEKGGKGPLHWPRLGLGGVRNALSPGKLFLVSMALLLSALILQNFESGLVGILFWLGLLLFIAAYAMFFLRSGSRPELRWRGQPVRYRTKPSLWERVRRRFQR